MKLKELLKFYYKTPSEVTMSNSKVISGVYKELVLPGTFGTLADYRKTLSWNLDREVYYREASKEENSKNDNLYVTMTTGKIDFYFVFEKDSDFTELLEEGLKKHRGYRKEHLPWDATRKFLFLSKRYE